MKKRIFLAPIAILAASLAGEQALASTNNDQKIDVVANVSSPLESVIKAGDSVLSATTDPFSFVLKTSEQTDVMAYHSSHRSHSSHSSHGSHRSHYSGR